MNPPPNYDDHKHTHTNTHTNTPALARARTHTHTNTHTQERGQEQGSEGQQIPLFLAARILRLGRKEVPDLMTPLPAEYHDKAASQGGGDRPTEDRLAFKAPFQDVPVLLIPVLIPPATTRDVLFTTGAAYRYTLMRRRFPFKGFIISIQAKFLYPTRRRQQGLH